MPSLPARLDPPAPFPAIVSQVRDEEFVAPGVVRATYRLQTSDGPLAVTVVAVDPSEPTVRIDSVVAEDHMISRGETLSSMAKRTGAIAGVNADYFDIGNTNQPLNLVVRGGALERTPSKRVVLAVHRDRRVTFERASFTGTVSYGAARVPLTTVNEWPPQGGAGLLNATYGVRKDVPGVRVIALAPLDPQQSANDISGSYRVVDAGTAGSTAQLAFGPAALAIAQPPLVGDAVTIAATLTPPLDDLACAVGGGPLLVVNGALADDPNSPAPEERDRHFPVSGAGTRDDGDLVLASIDGRQSDSIGLTRPQFAALWLGLGATDAMAFDSGGSSEIVARVLGQPEASVLGSPSDGQERRIADGLFIYSDAPIGPASRLVVRPRAIVALAGTDVPITLALVDDAGHALGATHAAAGDVIHVGAQSRVAVVRANGIAANVAVSVVDRPASVTITSDSRNADPGETVRLRARAFGANGRTIAVGDRVRWTASSGTFVAPGVLRVGGHDARVIASIAGVEAKARILVGNRRVPLDLFGSEASSAWHFATAPVGGAGSATIASGVLHLAYDFTTNGRAAYANGTFAIPGEPQSFAVDIFGDGSGIGVRAAFVNVLGERRALTLTKTVDWKGWRTVSIPLPDDLNPPVTLLSLYAFDGLDGVALHGSGSLAFRNATAVLAGTP
jgi:hypothetical protein